VYNLNASWKESINVMVYGWCQKEFSKQIIMAAGGWKEGRMMRVEGTPRRNKTNQQK
jgi:hypothetical protein